MKTNHKTKNIKNKIKNLEAIGLLLLLVSFGWHCLESHSEAVITEDYVYQLNEKLNYVLMSEYDEALKDKERYQGNAVTWVNYDGLSKSITDWKQVQESVGTLKKQKQLFFYIRAGLYVLGSLCVIISKSNFKKGLMN